MNERTFLQQLYLLQCDIEACPQRDAFAAQQQARWAARLADLLTRRNAAQDCPAALVTQFVETCRDIREGSPNAFYAHVDAFCKAVDEQSR